MDSYHFRERLDSERRGLIKDYRVFGYKLKVILGYNKKNELKEIQFFGGKRGSLIFGFLQTISLLISKLLQYGCSIESIASKMEVFEFEPCGFFRGEKYNSFNHVIAKILRENKYLQENGKDSTI